MPHSLLQNDQLACHSNGRLTSRIESNANEHVYDYFRGTLSYESMHSCETPRYVKISQNDGDARFGYIRGTSSPSSTLPPRNLLCRREGLCPLLTDQAPMERDQYEVEMLISLYARISVGRHCFKLGPPLNRVGGD
ncbi:hypothetical protein PTI98_000537 [Pleurotus ostreatus]|nr:hypothetical protein PTI98_000537 [Pleurotus ostreatus]